MPMHHERTAYRSRPKGPDFDHLKQMQGPPTPWIPGSMPVIDTGTSAGYIPKVKFRLFIRRRGKSLYVETAPDSPDYPNMLVPVHRSRARWFDLDDAGRALVRMSRWDYPERWMERHGVHWAKHVQREDLMGLIVTVGNHLPSLLNPKRGRPRERGTLMRVQAQTLPQHYDVNGGSMAGRRRARRQELLAMLDKQLELMEPHVERARNRRRMGGFHNVEVGIILRALLEAQGTISALRHGVYSDTLGEQQ